MANEENVISKNLLVDHVILSVWNMTASIKRKHIYDVGSRCHGVEA
jgi:hypothetical protein